LYGFSKLPIVRGLLGVQQLFDSIFLSPPTATCGIKAYYYQDKDAKSVFEKVRNLKVCPVFLIVGIQRIRANI